MGLDWQQLGIEPTLDQRAIKRAYAVRLKQCRPDERPEAFQKLHAAYKQALEWAAWQAYQLAEAAGQNDADDRQQQPAPAASTDGADSSQQEQAPLLSAEILALPLTASRTSSASDELVLPQLSSAEPQADEHLPASLVADATVIDDSQPQTPLIVDQPSTASTGHGEALASPLPTAATDEAEPPTTNPYAKEGNRLLALVDALLADPKRAVIPARWQFIGASPLLLDLNFNWQLGVRICERLARYNLAHKPPTRKSRRADMRLGSGVLHTLDLYFNWQHNRDRLERALGQEHCDAALRTLTEPRLTHGVGTGAIRGGKLLLNNEGNGQRGEMEWLYAHAFKRGLAALVDLVLLWLPLSGIYWLVETHGVAISQMLPTEWWLLVLHAAAARGVDLAILLTPPAKVVTLGVSYIFFCWLTESSEKAATPGKRLFGLQVFAKGIKPVGYIHGFVRNLMLAITAIGTYLTLLINLLMGRRFLHDLLSNSMVIDVRRSRKLNDPIRYKLETRQRWRRRLMTMLDGAIAITPFVGALLVMWFLVLLQTDQLHWELSQNLKILCLGAAIGLVASVRAGLVKISEWLA